jgi:hypothetical protein
VGGCIPCIPYGVSAPEHKKYQLYDLSNVVHRPYYRNVSGGILVCFGRVTPSHLFSSLDHPQSRPGTPVGLVQIRLEMFQHADTVPCQCRMSTLVSNQSSQHENQRHLRSRMPPYLICVYCMGTASSKILISIESMQPKHQNNCFVIL